MANATSSNASRLPDFEGYFEASRQPLASLVFVAPLLAVYEAGVLWLGVKAVRNGADVWLRNLLDTLDLDQYFLLPGLTVFLLLAWHYTTRRPWRIDRSVLPGMLVECVLLAIILRLILQAEMVVWHAMGGPTLALPSSAALSFGSTQTLAELIGFLGAGVYEELLFRLILLSAVAWTARHVGFGARAAPIAAIVLTSLIFSAAHYIGPSGDPVQWSQWMFWFGAVFRYLAGMFFSMLFVWRGFGIAVGAHAGYDLLVQVL